MNIDDCGRFFFAVDINRDGSFTITDVWLMAQFVFLLPAKVATWVISGVPWLAHFFEMDCDSGGGWGGALFCLLVWWVLREWLNRARYR